MYALADDRAANRRVRLWQARLMAVLAPLLALYVLGVVRDCYALMLGVMLAAFIACVLICDLALLPALRYRRFLRDLRSGLRRSTVCTLLELEEAHQMQDGAQVSALHVLLDDGDSRIFYVNVEKAELLPQMDSRVCLTSCGRHVVECTKL